MKTIILITLIAVFLVSATCSFAAEKSKIIIQIDASTAAVDALASKVGENRDAMIALEQARTSLKKATELQGKGRQLLGFNIGFGDPKPETEDEIKTYLEISDIAVATATARLEKARASSELDVIDKQLASIKAKIKVFEDRKAELEKLKADAAKCQIAAKEVETLKSEKTLLASQIETLLAERTKAEKLKGEQTDLSRKAEEMKAENLRLSGQIEKQLAEIKSLTTELEKAKKVATETVVPEKTAPIPVRPPVPTEEAPAVK